ncbi:MAG: SprB repeat-containing protein [Bacteroidales bacterium]|nr:SprB repeat-containing protein [Bacteroidales bacterium]
MVTITDANGCTATASATVNNIGGPAASISAQTNVACNGAFTGSATVLATGGTSPFTYLWNDPSAQTLATATGLAAGTYTVTITDANGCTATAQAIITQPTALSGGAVAKF